MSALSVWFLLVFLPNLYLPLHTFLALSFLGVGVGLITWGSYKIEQPDIDNHRVRKDSTDVILEDYYERKYKSCSLGINFGKSLVKWSIFSAVVSSTLLAGVPDRKEIAAIVLIPYVSNNTEFQKIPENLAKKLNDYLTETTKEVIKGETE